jgi:transposase-like protein
MSRNKMQQNATRSKQLRPEQVRVIEDLVIGASVTDAARVAGVDRTTVHRWMRNAVFNDELNHAHREMRLRIQAAYRTLGNDAVKVIREILQEPQIPASVRLKAALAVLEQTDAGKCELIDAQDNTWQMI